MPLFGPPNVEKLKAKGDVRGLIKALRYSKDPAVPLGALQALAEIKHARQAIESLRKSGGTQALEPLIAALMMTDIAPSLRKAAARALSELGWRPDRSEAGAAYWIAVGRWDKCVEIGEPAIGPLGAALAESRHAASAARALGRIGSELAAGPLIAAFKGETASRTTSRRTRTTVGSSVPGAIADALAQIGAPAAGPLVAVLHELDGTRSRSACDVLVTIGRSAVTPLISALGNRKSQVLAAEALGRIGDARSVEPLVAALADKDTAVRLAAAKALEQIGDPRAVPPLIAQLGSGRSAERQEAAVALGEIGDPRAVEPLVGVLAKSTTQGDRQAAAKALSKLGWQPGRDRAAAVYWVMMGEWQRCVEVGAPAVEPLAGALRHRSQAISAGAADALAKIGPPAVEALLRALQEGKTGVRTRAVEALGRIGDRRAVEPLISTVDASGVAGGRSRAAREALLALRVAVVRALAQIGDPRSTVPLTAAIVDGREEVRDAALEALREAGDSETLLLADALVRPGPKEAVATLQRLGGERAVHLLVELLGLRSTDMPCRAAALLGHLGDPRAIEPLRTVLQDAEPSVRESAATALARLGDLQAIESLGVLLKDRDSGARRRAAEALGNLPDPRAVELLVGALDDDERRTRRAVGTALVRLYGEGHLDHRSQQAILAQRQRIVARHADRDRENEKGCYSWHEDSGIGVDFPL